MSGIGQGSASPAARSRSPRDAGWAAPTPTASVDAEVRLPGSKSLTNRYLALAALASQPSRLRAPLRSRDTVLMAAGIAALGCGLRDEPRHGDLHDRATVVVPTKGTLGTEGDDWVVDPIPGGSDLTVDVDCGLAGTVMRFLPPVAAATGRPAHFDGDPHARKRPLAPLLSALGDLGVDVVDSNGFLPASIRPARDGLAGGDITLDARGSSQFISGMLLVGARCRTGLTVRHVGGRLPSRPHIAMTVENLRDCGVVVDDDLTDVWRVEPGEISGLDVEIEPDLSNAGPFLAAALATGGRVRVLGWPQYTTQAGDAFRDILDAMGADVRLDREGLVVTSNGTIYGVDLDLSAAGEIAPTVAALTALADTPSRLSGIGHLRGHETDRLQALSDEINSLGGDVRILDDGLEIHPRPLHAGVFHAHADHRMATTGAIIGLRVPGVVVDDIATTDKTMPDFPEMWSALCGATGQ